MDGTKVSQSDLLRLRLSDALEHDENSNLLVDFRVRAGGMRAFGEPLVADLQTAEGVRDN